MKSPIILRIFKGEQLIEVKQFDSDQIVFGHNTEVTVNLSDSAVAPIHALIELRDSGYYICDLGSQSGTFRNDSQILDEPINSGDEIKIGPFKIAFFVGVPKPKGAPAPTLKPVDAPTATPKLEDKPAAKVLEKVPDAPAAPEPEVKAIEPESKKASTPKATAKIPTASPLIEKSSGSPTSYEEAPVVAKPSLGKKEAQYLSQKGDNKKSPKTFAPPSEIKDLRKFLKPQKGPLTEVIVSWKERIIGTYHFGQAGVVRIGSSEKNEIVLPKGIAPDSFHLVELGPSLHVSVNQQMSVELIGNNNSVQGYDELIAKGRIANSGRASKIRVEQGEMLKIGLYEDTVQIFIRYAPAAGQVALAPALELTAS
ncbi:MAG: FHA domain-containing protein, partial [Pseudobdellovibrionaceae bacterium]